MANIPDFIEAEQKYISGILFERYGKLVPIQLADSELQLGGDPSQLTDCPLSTGTDAVHISSCARSCQIATAANLNDDDYHGPLMV
jgi:hypothetical protein